MKTKKDNSNFKIDEIMLVLIVAVAAVVVSVYDRIHNSPVLEAEKITMLILDDQPASIMTNGTLDRYKMDEIKNMKYADFKNYLNVKNDFCIYIQDANGNIILSKGSSKLAADLIHCKE